MFVSVSICAAVQVGFFFRKSFTLCTMTFSVTMRIKFSIKEYYMSIKKLTTWFSKAYIKECRLFKMWIELGLKIKIIIALCS